MISLFNILSELNCEPINEVHNVDLAQHKKNPHGKSMKSRVRIYKSITDALRQGFVGQVFSTTESDRLYVITVQKWGTDTEQIINGRSAKAFYSYKDAKKFAVRTMVRHAGERSKDIKKSAFGGKDEKEFN
jgi:hypothetical protein